MTADDYKVNDAPLVLDKDAEIEIIKPNIYMRLAKARLAVQKRCTKKSGHNKFADYHYFTLDDILAPTTEELEKVGLIALFNIKKRRLPIGVVEKDIGNVTELVEEYGELSVTDGNLEIIFELPTADAMIKGASTIQNLGGKNSYIKRYLYMNAMELSEEDDEVETDNSRRLITPKQAKYIRDIYKDQLSKLVQELGLAKLEDMTSDKASEIIDKIKHPTSNVEWDELDRQYEEKMKEE